MNPSTERPLKELHFGIKSREYEGDNFCPYRLLHAANFKGNNTTFTLSIASSNFPSYVRGTIMKRPSM